MLKHQQNKVAKMIDHAKSKYYNESITNANCKETFKIIGELIDTKSTTLQIEASNELAESIADFFCAKVRKIRQDLDNAHVSDRPVVQSAPLSVPTLSFFPLLTDDVFSQILKSCEKACSLDPLPLRLMKDPCVLRVLQPTIIDIINRSLSSAEVPQSLKIAQVSPRLKKPGLDATDYKNLRPISNLPSIEKMLEKTVAKSLLDHLHRNDILDPHQSAYRAGHSTETAIIKIHSDINAILDRGDNAILILLDLSAAFDTVDHRILLDRLKSIGIADLALNWFSSYLRDRQQYVQVGSARSTPHTLDVGVPQGSVLGPILFLLYTLPIGQIFENHGLKYHIYADDTQVYYSLPPRNEN